MVFFEHCFESIQLLFLHPGEGLQPIVQLDERVGTYREDTTVGVGPDLDNTGIGQDTKMLGGLRQFKTQSLRNLPQRQRADITQ